MDGTTARTDVDPEERLKARVQKSSAYEKYKASLHAFFNGDKPLPDHLREMLATRPGAEKVLGEREETIDEAAEDAASAKAAQKKTKKRSKGPKNDRDGTERKARRMVSAEGNDYGSLVEAVRRATSPREGETSLNALRAAGYALPLDGEILSKALGHSDEEVISEALRGLLQVAETGGVKSPRLLRTRLDNVALLTSSTEVRSLCAELKAKLA